ncbi:MAG: hypothetical protein RBU37_11910 [Myxococcota bacterium]|jgi:hypothetical protein|nr:hypothetical protein [Myxococcota bacterium]
MRQLNPEATWNEEERLTLWTKPEETLKSRYGTVSYKEWCERERERIVSNGGSAKIIVRQDGWMALFR